MDSSSAHPGGKLRDEGAGALSEAELLAILISTGIKGRSAVQIAEDLLARFGSIVGMSNQPLERFLAVKGLSDVKIIRIAAAMEIARRIILHGDCRPCRE
ncbi:MAG: hypothetical protein FJ291_01490 [Planctomycetes bacterium]|nr:hypothetical protein [Planctomycetota bacterium]